MHPSSRAVNSAHELRPSTRVVETDLKFVGKKFMRKVAQNLVDSQELFINSNKMTEVHKLHMAEQIGRKQQTSASLRRYITYQKCCSSNEMKEIKVVFTV